MAPLYSRWRAAASNAARFMVGRDLAEGNWEWAVEGILKDVALGGPAVEDALLEAVAADRERFWDIGHLLRTRFWIQWARQRAGGKHTSDHS